MRTLIELYDTSPIRNVLATVMFCPQEMILICPPEVAEDPNQKRSLRDFFAYLNCPVKLTLIPVTLLDAGKTERVLREVLESHQDCAIDISGGTDAALLQPASHPVIRLFLPTVRGRTPFSRSKTRLLPGAFPTLCTWMSVPA